MGSEFVVGASLLLAGVVVALVAVGIGYAMRGGWVYAAEQERDAAKKELATALAKLAAERQGHEAYAALARSVDAEGARRARLAADPDLGDIEFARRMLRVADPPAASTADPLPPTGAATLGS